MKQCGSNMDATSGPRRPIARKITGEKSRDGTH
jgi:hypothetical protein